MCDDSFDLFGRQPRGSETAFFIPDDFVMFCLRPATSIGNGSIDGDASFFCFRSVFV